MRILLTGNYTEMFVDDYCFNTKHSLIHENCYTRLHELKKSFEKLNVKLVSSAYLNDKDFFDAIIVYDHPTNKILSDKIINSKKPTYLIAEEAPFILPENYDLKTTKNYKYIFSWYEDYIDDKKIFHHFSLFPDTNKAIENIRSDVPVEKKHGKVLVASLRKINHKNSFYSYRKKLATWYAKNGSLDFSLYGRYWSRYYFSGQNILIRLLNSRYLDFIFNNNKYDKIYKGLLKSKYNELNIYCFQFCIENALNYKGYITEKIFDSIVCRNIPVYYPSAKGKILELIPKDIYIDASKFNNFEDLNNYLNNLTFDEIDSFLKKAEYFINNLPIEFSPSYASDKLAKKIYNDLINNGCIKDNKSCIY